MRQATASAKLLDPILQIARHMQQDPKQLLEAQGIDADRVEQPGARIPAPLFGALLDELALRTDNPLIALRTGEATQPRMLGSVGFVISTAARLGDALQLLSHYLPLLIEGVHLSVQPQEDNIELGIELEEKDQRSLSEWLMACLYNWPRWLTGHHLPLERVEFSFPSPAQPQRYEQFFAAEVTFDAPRTRFWFHARQLERPCLDANEELQRHHQSFADQLLSHAGRDGALVARIKSYIRALLEQGLSCDRQQMAQHLAMSLRTMQRKLDQQQTSFQALFDSSRQEMALQLIQRGDRSLGEISYQLGFSSLSAFQKAFKRWTGSAPGQWREQHRPDPLILRNEQPRTLAELAQQGLSESAFYPLAIQLLQRLQEQRARQLPNPALHPAQISVHFDDSGLAHINLHPAPKLPLPFDEQLPFCPPESGRLLPYRPDERSNLFRLGALFYYLLHGQPPFTGRDTATTLIAQLQQSPAFSEQLSPALQLILGRLLSRPLEERYQHLSALLHDLQLAHYAEIEGRDLGHFHAASQDRPPFALPPTLYEREEPLERLHQALSRCQRGQAACILLEGDIGSGRGALIDQLRLFAWRAQIPLIDIDAQQTDVINGCHTLASQLLRQKLVLPPAQRQIAAQRIRRQLGRQALADAAWLPELAALLELNSTAPATDPIDPSSATALLHALLSSHPGPLVLVIENLTGAVEWQQLCATIQRRAQPHHLLLLSVDSQPSCLPEIAADERIRLLPLSAQGVQQWLADLFGAWQPEQRTLADWLLKQSQGKPAEVVTALEAMRQRGWLHFHAPRWQWRASNQQQPLDPQLRSLLSHSYHNQPPVTQQMLQWAAVAGDPFSPQWLADARQDPLQRIEIHLWPAQQAGLLRQSQQNANRIRFSHPELSQPIMEQIDPALRTEMQWRLGRTLQQHWRRQPDSTLLQRCTDLLNATYASRPRQALRAPLSRLNQQAAEDAANNGHLQLALSRMQSAIDLTPNHNALRLTAVELALQTHSLIEACNWLPDREDPTLTESEQLRWTLLHAQRLQAQNQPLAAIEQLKATLRQQGAPLADTLVALEQPLTAPTAIEPTLAPLLGLLAELAEAQFAPQLAYQTLLCFGSPMASAASRAYFLHQFDHANASQELAAADADAATSAPGLQLSLQLRWRGWQQSRSDEIQQLEALAQNPSTSACVQQTAQAYALWLRALGGEPLNEIVRNHPTQSTHAALQWLAQSLDDTPQPNAPQPHAADNEDTIWGELASWLAGWLLDQHTTLSDQLAQQQKLLQAFDGTTLAWDIGLIGALRLAHFGPLVSQQERPQLQRAQASLTARNQLLLPLNPDRLQTVNLALATLNADAIPAEQGFEQLLDQLPTQYHLLRSALLEAYASLCANRDAQHLARLLRREAAEGWQRWGAPVRSNQMQLAVGSASEAG